MRNLGISEAAERDLAEIFDYTQDRWSDRQALRYLTYIRDSFQLLVEHPMLGRPCNSMLEDLRRYEFMMHVVFYIQDDQAVLIIRVLHASMMALPQYFDDSRS